MERRGFLAGFALTALGVLVPSSLSRAEGGAQDVAARARAPDDDAWERLLAAQERPQAAASRSRGVTAGEALDALRVTFDGAPPQTVRWFEKHVENGVTNVRVYGDHMAWRRVLTPAEWDGILHLAMLGKLHPAHLPPELQSGLVFWSSA